MIDLNEINDEIAKLEHSATTYGNCEKLSVLYSVRDNFGAETAKRNAVHEPVQAYSYAAKTAFMEAIEGKPIASVLGILDEHLAAVEAVYPKEYNAVLRRIRSLQA